MFLTRNKIKSLFESNRAMINYSVTKEDTDMIILCKKTDSYILKFDCRLQFGSFLRFNPFTIQLNKLENFVYDLIIEELKKYYCNDIGFVIKDFYKTDYSFSQEITSDAHLEEFLSEFYKCLSYYEQEVFPNDLVIKDAWSREAVSPNNRISSQTVINETDGFADVYLIKEGGLITLFALMRNTGGMQMTSFAAQSTDKYIHFVTLFSSLSIADFVIKDISYNIQ